MQCKVDLEGRITFDKADLLEHADDFCLTSRDIRDITRQACTHVAQQLLGMRDMESQVSMLLDRQIELAIRDLGPAIERAAATAMHAAIERRISAISRDAAIECKVTFPNS